MYSLNAPAQVAHAQFVWVRFSVRKANAARLGPPGLGNCDVSRDDVRQFFVSGNLFIQI